ncbi:MAG: PaREP1 family protein [Acidianus hospitalis]
MEELIKKAEEKGIDVEDLIISAISRIDPQDSIKLRFEIAKRFLSEAEDYLSKGDIIQSSEKAYKVAEEVIKALAEKFNLPEYQQALREGRWYTYSLANAAGKLALSLGKWVKEGWDSAYVLHVWGFREGKLDLENVRLRIQDVKNLLENAQKV